MKYIKPIKVVTFVCCVGFATYYTYFAVEYSKRQIDIYRRKIAMEIIGEDLSHKQMTIETNKKAANKQLDKMSSDELRRAIWIVTTQNDDLQYALSTVKNALEYAKLEEK